jgi:hypothetical protein
MPTTVDPPGSRGELVRLVRRIQALTLEVQELRSGEAATPELQAKEKMLEQLRWRLAVVARRSALDDLGAAA